MFRFMKYKLRQRLGINRTTKFTWANKKRLDSLEERVTRLELNEDK